MIRPILLNFVHRSFRLRDFNFCGKYYLLLKIFVSKAFKCVPLWCSFLGFFFDKILNIQTTINQSVTNYE